MNLNPLLAQAELARRYTAEFIAFTKEDYQFNWHHKLICEKIDRFINKQIKNLIIFAPPQHGKSEITTRRTPAKILGNDPTKRIAVVSYSATLAQSFNRDIQRIIDDERYHLAFPGTILNESNVVSDRRKGYIRNNDMFETIPHRGSVRTVGVDGTLTGFPVDIAIFDDLYKSRTEALSSKRRLVVESFWDSVLMPRLHNESQILGTFTRWSEHDLGAVLMGEKDFEVITIPAIKIRNGMVGDPRKVGEALWPEKHSLERLSKIRDNPRSLAVWNSLYQQEPKAAKDILIYKEWEEIDKMPNQSPKFYAMDFGFSNDPTTVIEMELHKGALYVNEICYQTQMMNSKIHQVFKEANIGINRCWADSEDPKTIAELNQLKNPKLNILPAKKGPGSLLRGILKVQELKMFVTKNSVNVKRELNNYQWVIGPDGKPTNVPLANGNDHCLDPIRYGYEGYTGPKISI